MPKRMWRRARSLSRVANPGEKANKPHGAMKDRSPTNDTISVKMNIDLRKEASFKSDREKQLRAIETQKAIKQTKGKIPEASPK
jgi:hypothetical protein